MKKGFSLLEVIIYLSIAFVVMIVVVGFVFWLIDSNSKNRAVMETLNSAKRAIEIITYETREAEDVYTPTTSLHQLSLETKRHIPGGEDSSYVDFYLCGTHLCMKKDSQDSIVLTPESVEVSDIDFTYILSGSFPSIKINLTVEYNNFSSRSDYGFSTSLESTVSLRNYE